jgi:hypothetical protein
MTSRSRSSSAIRPISAGGILRGIQNHELGSWREAIAEQVEVEGEAASFLQGNRHGPGAEKPDHGFIDGETGIGINHFIARLDERQQGEEHDRLAARHHGDVARLDRNAAGA